MPPGTDAASPHVAFFLPHLGGGGTEKMVATLGNGLSALGYRVDMVVVQARGVYLESLAEEIRVIDLHARNSYLAVPGLMRYLQQRRPDVLVSALSLTNVLALIAARLAGSRCRVAVRIESTASAQHRVPWKKALEKPLLSWVYPWADRIIAVSHAVAEDASQYLGIAASRINVIYNPVLPDAPAAAESNRPDHPWFGEGCLPVILAVGRLVPVKDFPTLLRAFALLRANHPAHLLILGEGEERDPLLLLAQQLGLADDFQLGGFVKDVPAYMRHSTIFALSSLYEGLPTALIEALASGCAVVSTDCPGGSREILADGAYGELVPVGDPDALAAAFRLSLSGERKMVAQAWLDQFKLGRVLQQTIRVLGLPALEK